MPFNPKEQNLAPMALPLVEALSNYQINTTDFDIFKFFMDELGGMIPKLGYRDAEGNTLLYIAALKGNSYVVGRLLEYESVRKNIDAEGSNGTALKVAFSDEKIMVFQKLINAGASTEFKDYRGRIFIEQLFNKHDLRFLKVMLLSGRISAEELNTLYDVEDFYSEDVKNKSSFLHKVVERGKVEIAELIIANGGDVNIVNSEGKTPLHCVRESDLAMASLLIAKGADVNRTRNGGGTLLHTCKNAQLTKILLENGANPNLADNKRVRPLHMAADRDESEMVELLLANGAEVDAVDSEGKTALHNVFNGCYIYKNAGKTIECLISSGADINKADAARVLPIQKANRAEDISALINTPQNLEGLDMLFEDGYQGKTTLLHKAVRSVNYEFIEYLLSKGIDIDIQDEKGFTPLKYAIASENIELSKYLVGKGANIKFLDKEGRSFLHTMAEVARWRNYHSTDRFDQELTILEKKQNYLQILRWLIAEGLDINLKSNEGYTPLHVAVMKENEFACKILISKGANISIADGKGNTALHIALIPKYGIDMLDIWISGSLGFGNSRKNIMNLLITHISDNLDFRYAIDYSGKPGEYEVEKLNNTLPDINFKYKGKTLLQRLVELGEETFVGHLVGSGADFSIPCDDGKVLLHYAVIKRLEYLAETLIKVEADVNVVDNQGKSLLAYFFTREMYYKDKEKVVGIAKLLLQHPDIQNTDVVSDTGDTLLHWAANFDDEELLHILLEKQLDPNAKNNQGETPLHIASHDGKINFAKLLLEYGADINAISEENDNTPLHFATENDGDVGMVSYLILRGANINVKNIYNITPFEMAVKDNNDCKIVFMHHLKNMEINNIDAENSHIGGTMLCAAVINNDLELVKFLLMKKASVNITNSNKESPLHLSCKNGNLQITELLCKHNANLNAKNEKGEIPMFEAIRSGNPQLCAFLLSRKRNFSIKCVNKTKKTLLHVAAAESHYDRVDEHLEILQQIVSLKTNINAKDKYQKTPLHMAAEHSNEEHVKALVENKASLKMRDGKGKTALHHAVEKQKIGVINYLLDKGAPINVQDNKKQTVLHYAVDNWCGHANPQIVKILLERGIDFNLQNNKGKKAIENINSYNDKEREEIKSLLEQAEANSNLRCMGR